MTDSTRSVSVSVSTPAQINNTNAAPMTPSVSAIEDATYSKYGRVADDGTVYVKDGDTERAVGQFPDAIPENPLHLYIRRFLDLKAKVDLFESRIPHIGERDIDKTIKSLRVELEEPQAVGDLQGLRAHFDKLIVLSEQRKEEAKQEREASRKAAVAHRTEIVETAEAIAAQDPERTQWKSSAQTMRELLEQWKTAQRQGPRMDRSTEDSLWKRFSTARTHFDRNRRHFFSQLDASQTEAKRLKGKIVERAEALASSTDWSATATAFHDLMNEWKTVGRASRKDDDALWERFRSAQQRFFDARRAAHEALDASYEANLKVKEQLLERAEAILPVTDVEAAKNLLRPIQSEWEAAGRVPRAHLDRIEGRMRAVEDAIRDAEEEQWRKSNPETKARAEGLIGQLEAKIEQLEAELAAAKAKNNDKKAKSIEDELSTRKAWLNQVRSVAE